MAERRMFAKTIIDSDAFLDMPMSTQALYFHLCMRADDDGFVNNPKRIQRTIGSSDDDLKLLIVKRFVLAFESGVIVIKHWRLHNYIRRDTYKETLYTSEKESLSIRKDGSYTDHLVTSTLQLRDGSVDEPSTQVRLGKDRLGKVSKEESGADKPPTTRFSPPTLEEVTDYCLERGNGIDPQRFIDYYSSNGWMVGRTKMKDWKASVRTWEKREKGAASGQASNPTAGKSADEKWGIKSAITVGD